MQIYNMQIVVQNCPSLTGILAYARTEYLTTLCVSNLRCGNKKLLERTKVGSRGQLLKDGDMVA